MNPLTQVKGIQKLNSREAALGISEDASWHAKYKDSAYVFVGGIPYDLTEGDLLAIFAQYGEIVDVNLVRDKASGKSKGFAFVAYEDQRSTNLAVDNLNGAQIIGRTIRVDHVGKYKKKEEEEEEDEETKRQKREERGVCRAFQRGECKWGAECKFSHDEQRAANTGWGHEEDFHSRQAHNKFGGGGRIPEKRPADIPSGHDRDYGASKSRKVDERDGRGADKRSSRSERESYDREDYGRREEKRTRRPGREDYERRDIQDERDREKRPSHSRDSSSLRHRDRDNDDHPRSRR